MGLRRWTWRTKKLRRDSLRKTTSGWGVCGYRQDLNTTNRATDSAKREGEIQYAKAIQANPALAQQAGGIDKYGESRAVSGAASVISAAFDDAVTNEKKTMLTTPPDKVKRIMKDDTQSPERRAAAGVNFINTGGQNAIDTIDYLGSQAPSAAISAIQQQVVADAGNNMPAAVGATARAELGRGEFSGDMNTLMTNRIRSGKLSAEIVSKMPVEQLNQMLGVLRSNPGLQSDANFKELQKEVLEFRTSPQLHGRQPTPEITAKMDDIGSI